MRTLVHLSDLHFGRVDPALIEPLLQTIRAAHPDLVIVSGDLTQRAKREQFRQAREFLNRLPKPYMVIPGNHDVPLHNLYSRVFQSLVKYRRYISDELEPFYLDEEMMVVAINTARWLTVAGGRINSRQIRRAQDLLYTGSETRIRVVVTHHPFDLPPNVAEKHLVGRGKAAMSALTNAGVDLFLAGHLHLWHADLTTPRYSTANRTAIIVQSGTSLSTRTRGEANSFNLLELDTNTIKVERLVWSAEYQGFRRATREVFQHGPGGWIKS